MERLIIAGASGNACDILDIVEAINGQGDHGSPVWDVAGILDDRLSLNETVLGLPVLGRLSDSAKWPDCKFIFAIGSDRSYRQKERMIGSLGLPGDRYATLVHPRSSVSSRAVLGRGVYVNYGVSIAGRVTVEDQAAIGANVTIGHDAQIGAYATLAPGAIVSGSVKIQRGAYIGAGAMIRQGLVIGEKSLIGLGAVVVKDVEAGSVMVGNPARPLQREG